MADSSFAATFDDPRVDPRFCRRISGDDGDVFLVGVVHDHPASVARVRSVLESVRPAVLALELPSAAIDLYRMYAREDATPPRFGGEMSAAIQAAPDADVVGIDAPNWSFLRRLIARLVADRVPLETAKRVMSGLGSATREAMTCRLAATVTRTTAMTVACDDRIEYAVDHADPPARQAAHERTHVAGVRALIGDDNGASAYRDETRERCMVDRLESIRNRGDVVAVVGIDHLEALETAITE
ncbi:hypothetical protein [Natrialbaceae archaeon AArc-T1-2]|uniref:hypothetical protein n=1 Tax=Natrialbaceae archaeon AArc-T1-2 TaxID=3053904 RepID=UPI00255B1DED|nr:hypothetical protein [Natrialbaceae archaeon AArc-T1-2]WIV68065.1 hypothetical protein QQ977_04860 [Natrialbaceae archaeon AArc-T1-2]